MAIIIIGLTKCAICDNVISDEDDCLGFPAFLQSDHKLWRYSDSGFHTSCFENWEHCEEFNSIFNQINELKLSKPKIPDGMSFEEFERTDAYKMYLVKQDEIYIKVIKTRL